MPETELTCWPRPRKDAVATAAAPRSTRSPTAALVVKGRILLACLLAVVVGWLCDLVSRSMHLGGGRSP